MEHQELYTAIVALPHYLQRSVESFVLEENRGLARINDIISTNLEYRLRRMGTPTVLEELHLKFYTKLLELKIEHERAVRECIVSLPN